MKHLYALFCAFLCAFTLQAQTIQEIATGLGYQKMSFVNLSTGTETQVVNTAWDIAFTVFGQQDAGIFINESGGTSQGQPLAVTELYDAVSTDFASQPDPAFFADYRMFNSEKSWDYGAFNENRDTANLFDYGWGTYNFATNQVVGSKVYVIKLRDGQYKKIKIESLGSTGYTFKYANLDGTNETTKTINKADHPGKTLAYFSFGGGNTVAVEPAGGFDLLYCRYSTNVFDPGSGTVITYAVTGILSGRGVQAARAVGVDPNMVTFAAYQDSLRSELDVVGHDWKFFTGTAWTMPEDHAYFVKTTNNHVWKVVFIDFEGSTTGKAILEKTDLGIIPTIAVQNPAAVGLEVAVFPNPTVAQVYVSLDMPAHLAKRGNLLVTDMLGRTVANMPYDFQEGFQVLELNAARWAAGTYTLHLNMEGTQIILGKMSKN